MNDARMTITLPFSQDTFWTFVGLASILALSLLVFLLIAQRERERRLPEKWQLKALGSFVGLLTPIWAALLGLVIYALWLVAWHFPAIGHAARPLSLFWGAITLPNAEGATDLRWHVLALVGLLTALGGLVGTPLALLRVLTNERQTFATETGLITDRINKAVQGLGAEKIVKKQRADKSGNPTYEKDEDGNPNYAKPVMIEETAPNLEVRIGAIYALERIAQDSLRDHVQIMEILCAYIRENSPREIASPIPNELPLTTSDWEDILTKPRVDIQTAINVIGRRSKGQRMEEGRGNTGKRWEGFRLDLRDACLQLIDFSTGNFSGAMFQKCRIEGAIGAQAHFEHCNFHCATLQGAFLAGANLTRANVSGTKLHGSNLNSTILNCIQASNETVFDGAHLQRSKLHYAILSGANFYRARLEEAELISAHLDYTNFHSANLTAAKLWGARMFETDFSSSVLSRARFEGTKMEGVALNTTTKLSGTRFKGSAMRHVDLREVNISQEQINLTFGDRTVKLRDLVAHHWPRIKEIDLIADQTAYNAAWRAFQRSIGFAPNDPSTWDAPE